MQVTTPELILQHSAGPIRWMPAGSPHRALIGRRVLVATQTGIEEVHGHTSSRFLDVDLKHVEFEDTVIAALSQRFHSLRALTDGGVWEGLLTSITGQAVSLHSAAAFQRRLCDMLSPAIESHGRAFWAIPSAIAVADSSLEQVKSIGLTTKRAQGLIDVAREVAAGNVSSPTDDSVDDWMQELTALPMVGPWTAASSLLWGVGHPDVYPKGDVALLRAAKRAYNNDGLTMNDLNVLSEGWRPQRSVAARLLWTNLLGMAWDD